MNVVLDAPVVIAAALTKGVCRTVFLETVEKHELIISQAIVEDYAQMTTRKQFKAYKDPLKQVILMICELGRLVPLSPSLFPLPHPEDSKYLALTENGAPSLLVTLSKDRFPEDTYGSIQVLSPKAFLDEMNNDRLENSYDSP